MFGKQNIIQVKSDNLEFVLSVDDVCTSVFFHFLESCARWGVNFDRVTLMNNSWNHNFFMRFLFRHSLFPDIFFLFRLWTTRKLFYFHFKTVTLSHRMAFAVLFPLYSGNVVALQTTTQREQSWETVNCSFLSTSSSYTAINVYEYLINNFSRKNYVSCQFIKLPSNFYSTWVHGAKKRLPEKWQVLYLYCLWTVSVGWKNSTIDRPTKKKESKKNLSLFIVWSKRLLIEKLN